MEKSIMNGGRLMLEKIKDQAAEIGRFKTTLSAARGIVEKVKCACGDVSLKPHCKRCEMLAKIDNMENL